MGTTPPTDTTPLVPTIIHSTIMPQASERTTCIGSLRLFCSRSIIASGYHGRNEGTAVVTSISALLGGSDGKSGKETGWNHIFSKKRGERDSQTKKKFKMLRNYYPWQIRSENELKSHSTQKVMAWLWVQCSRGRPLVGVERLGPSLEKRGGRKDHHTPPRVDAFTGNRQEDLFQEWPWLSTQWKAIMAR